MSAKEWVARLASRHKVLRRLWLRHAEECIRIYEAERAERHSFNILFSNTETILPVLYNSVPRPEVLRRGTNPARAVRQLDAAAAQAAERLLEFLIDTNLGEYESFESATEQAVRSMLVTGLGLTRVVAHGGKVCFSWTRYDRVLWGPGIKWQAVPWVAFGHDMTQQQFEESFPEFCQTDEYKQFRWDPEDSEQDSLLHKAGEEPTPVGPAVLVWEVWDAEARQTVFVCDRFQSLLRADPYPPALTGRFPCPEPLVFSLRAQEWCPIPPYQFYKRQAEELNTITLRIHRVVKAIKAKGIYNSNNPELQHLFEQDDDAILVPSESAVAFQEGLDKAIWFMPVQELVRTLETLYVAQQNCIQSIYQIMGISDIQRGATDPNETAMAQQIKSRWGGLRVQKLQRAVQGFCRDLLRIAFEMAVSYLSPADWRAITQLPYLTQGEAALLSSSPSSSLPSEQQAALGLPKWEELLELFASTFHRVFRIDIETNSTIELEAVEDRSEFNEFLAAFGQLMASIVPMVERGALPFEAVRVVLAEVARRYRFGRRVHDAIEFLEPPQAQPDPTIEAVRAEGEAREERLRAEGAKRLLEAEQTITALQREVQQLRLQVAEERAAGKVREVELKSNFASATAQQRESSQQRLARLRAELENARAGFMQKLEESVQQYAARITQVEELQAMQANKLAAVEQQQAAQTAQLEKLDAALAALLQATAQTQQALQEMLRLQAAPRVTEIVVDPATGRKSGVSRILQ